jgi:hypothetical protein
MIFTTGSLVSIGFSTLVIFLLTGESVLLRRQHILEGTDMLGVCFAALFALPTVRSLLPGAPTQFGAVIGEPEPQFSYFVERYSDMLVGKIWSGLCQTLSSFHFAYVLKIHYMTVDLTQLGYRLLRLPSKDSVQRHSRWSIITHKKRRLECLPDALQIHLYSPLIQGRNYLTMNAMYFLYVFSGI